VSCPLEHYALGNGRYGSPTDWVWVETDRGPQLMQRRQAVALASAKVPAPVQSPSKPPTPPRADKVVAAMERFAAAVQAAAPLIRAARAETRTPPRVSTEARR